MKTTMDYMVGNTALKIVNTGRKIKVIDVEKEKIKKSFWKRMIITLAVGVSFFWCCMFVLELQNTKTLLGEENYMLTTQIAALEQENVVLEKEADEVVIDYEDIFKQAKALGMDFPTQDQIYEYKVKKSSTIRYSGLE